MLRGGFVGCLVCGKGKGWVVCWFEGGKGGGLRVVRKVIEGLVRWVALWWCLESGNFIQTFHCPHSSCSYNVEPNTHNMCNVPLFLVFIATL